MSLLIDMLQGVLVLTALAVLFALASGAIVTDLVKMTNLKDKRIGWILFVLLNLGAGMVFWLAHDSFKVARSGLVKGETVYGVHKYDEEINEILQNQIWLISVILFFLYSWTFVWLLSISDFSLLEAKQKPIAIFLIATLIISFYGLNKSKKNLNEQARAYSVSHVFDLCKDAQKTLNEMESALNSNKDYTWMYEQIRSGRENLVFTAYQIERQSEHLSESFYGEYATQLEDRVNFVAEQASDTFIAKVLPDLYLTFDQDVIYSLMFKEDFRCEDWDTS